MDIFTLYKPTKNRVPILLSIPHSGVEIPASLKNEFNTSLLPPDDTDFYVDRLYEFAYDMGITVLRANISRWVIDLNRDPNGNQLYNDGRVITGLCPSTNFNGETMYVNDNYLLDAAEINRRTTQYFEPYHQKVQYLLIALRDEFGQVLLWDCHSIRRQVPGIQNDAFPDLILGTNEGESTTTEMAQMAANGLTSPNYNLSINAPFKGGYITRRFGRPEIGQHAMQLEMSKDLYMDDEEINYAPARAEKIQRLLIKTLHNLAKLITK